MLQMKDETQRQSLCLANQHIWSQLVTAGFRRPPVRILFADCLFPLGGYGRTFQMKLTAEFYSKTPAGDELCISFSCVSCVFGAPPAALRASEMLPQSWSSSTCIS